MLHDQMLQAKTFIQQRQYSEARTILEKVDHPKAREWLEKLDDIELGNPFSVVMPASQERVALPPHQDISDAQDLQAMQNAIGIMLEHGWQMKTQLGNTVYFEKRKLPNTVLCLILILLFSFIGALIVCAAIATSGLETVRLTQVGNRSVSVISRKKSGLISSREELIEVAVSVKDGVTYAGAITLGIIGLLVSLYLLTPHYR